MKDLKPIKIYIPLKILASKIKTIVGPTIHIEKHYYLTLSLVTPDPFKPRWEPHIIIDKNKLIGEDGFYKITGYVTLIKTEGLDAYMKHLVKNKLVGNYHLAPWGTPALVTMAIQEPLKIEETALLENKAHLILKALKKDKELFTIIEIN